MGSLSICSVDNVIADNVVMANTFFRRLTGLIPQKMLECGDGLILKPCKQVHTYFMNYNIDVIFISEGNEIVHLQRCMIPNKVTPFVRRAHTALEVSEGTIDKCGLKVGDTIEIMSN